MRPGITTESQADEVAQLLFYEDLKDVVLVGTSSGGMVVCRVAELMRDRVGRLVLVDALALLDGEKIRDIVTRSTASGPSGLDPPARRARTPPPACSPISTRRPAPGRSSATPCTRSGSTTEPVKLDSFWSQPWKASVIWCRRAPNPGEAHQRRAAEQAQGQLGRARHRPLPDAEHARGADGAIDRGRISQRKPHGS